MNPFRHITVAVFMLILPAYASIAQTSCASDQKNDSLILHDPVFSRSYFYMEQAISQAMALDPSERTDDVYVIPVVVHIIHEGEPVGTGSNISDAQIFSAIEALNEDFRKMPGTPGFGDGVDVGIEFCLAQRDPNGNASNGIIRVDGSSIPNYADMGIEAASSIGADEAAVKGLSTWPREQYMNIWVVNEIEDNNAQSGVQGYAYFPVNSPLDGIVVLHNAFGTVGNLKSYTNMNRTLTHEMGHSFALYHTFHNTSACSEANCTLNGDKVCDTPVTILAGDCSSPACSGTQQVENYLDYTAESCKNMFSEGQKVRMRATLESERATLISSLGCQPVSALDVGITAVISPDGTSCENTLSPVVTMTNFGSTTVTSATIQYNINGIGSNSFNWSGSLASGLSVNISLPAISGNVGTHTFYAWTVSPNAQTDQYPANDMKTAGFGIASGSNATFNIELDFFGSENTWEIEDSNGNVVASGGPYANNQQGLDISESICIPGGCYTFTISDSYGDGQGFISGNYNMTDANGTVLFSGSGNWGLNDIHDFCLDEPEAPASAPNANFTIGDNYLCLNGTTSFNDISTNTPTSWQWTFEGGSPSSSNAQNPQNIVFANAGTYDVTLVATNSSGTSTYVCQNCITVSAGPTVTLSAVSPLCNNATNGIVNSTVTGNGPFTYAWNNGQTTANLGNLPSGTYTLTVTDGNGCTKQSSTTLTNPTAISISQTITHVTCNGMNNGSITASATGGAGGYSWTWSNGATGNTASSLSAGVYTVTCTDANSCVKTKNITVNQPTTLLSNLSSFDIACSAVTGSAQVSPSGGTSPYTVSWSTGATGNTLSNLAAGAYSVTITDNQGCSVLSAFEIENSTTLSVNTTQTSLSCHGDTNASATAIAGGGSGNYTYTWSNGATGNAISGLAAGTYMVLAVDNNGCGGAATVIIAEPAAINLAVFKTDISCHGLADGSATATAVGGTGSIQYTWSNGITGNASDAMNSGTYLVTATDENDCAVTEAITIIEPSLLVAQVSSVNPETCASMDGSATVNIMGGTPQYAISWNNGQSQQVISGVSAGNYTAVISDANGCESQVELSIPYECSQPDLITQLVDTDCDAQELTPTDIIHCAEVPGAEMYNWLFTNAVGDILGDELSVGPAFLISQIPGITDGMTASIQIRVMADGVWGPFGPVCTITTASESGLPELNDEHCGGIIDQWGIIIGCTVVNGALNYEWNITGPDYEFSTFTTANQLVLSEALQLSAGNTYQVKVRCGMGAGILTAWSSECEITVDVNIGLAENEDHTAGEINFYPNPNNGEKIYFDFGNLDESTPVQDLMIFNSTGQLVNVQPTFSPTEGTAEYQFETPLSPGIYIIRFTHGEIPFEKKMIVR